MKSGFYYSRLFVLLIVLAGSGFNVFAQTSTFIYTGNIQTWTVLLGVTSLYVDMQGAMGGANSGVLGGFGLSYISNGGYGGRVQCNITVTPGQILNIYVGGQGQAGSGSGGTGGYNGGADGSSIPLPPVTGGGGGGGASDIRIGGTTLTDRVIAAGGGGGAGGVLTPGINLARGGDGGGLTGQTAYNDGVSSPGLGSGGGTQSAGGAPYGGPGLPGTLGYGSAGASGPGNPPNGGGGGGYFGGAGGYIEMGGGGGSSYTDPTLVTAVTHTQGYDSAGNGLVIITIPDYPPTFVSGGMQITAACENSSTDVSSLLAVNEINSGDLVTWNVVSGPSAGILSGFPFSMISTDSTLIPSGLTYAPGSGYTGPDSFTVQADDGIGDTVITTIYVTVNSFPAPITGAGSVCAGAMDTLTEDSTGGAWSSSNNLVASVDGYGDVSGISAGIDTISYTSGGCNVTFAVTVNPLPVAGTVAGGPFVCVGSSTLYSDTSSAYGTGVWSSDNTSVATVDVSGNVYGIIAGFADIVYTVTSGFTPGCGSVFASAPVVVNPLPAPIMGASNSMCMGATIALTEDSTGGVWSSSNSSVTIVDGSGNLFGVSAGTATISYTSGSGCSATFGDTVYPIPSVNPIEISPVCNESITAIVYFTGPVSGTVFNWTNYNRSIGLIANGIDSIGSFIALNPADTTVSATILVTPIANGCTGVADSVTISVNPTPAVDAVANQAVCNTFATTAVNLTGSAVSGTVYNWVNSDSGIGLAASDTGNIGSFIGMNTADTIAMGVISVTPVANSCAGSVQTFTITVYPTPTVGASVNQTICNGTTTTAVTFTGPVAGSSFSWTNNNTSIGLASGGLDSIPSFTGINTSTHDTIASIIVTAAANSCIGNSNSFAIQVNPTPKLNSPLVLPAICDNIPFTYTPESATAGTSYTWNRNTISGISNSAKTGIGNISDTLDNTTTHSVGVIYVYTLSANFCTNIQSVAVPVNPLPTLSTGLTPPALCSGTPFIYGPASGVTGTVFTWSRAVVSGISNLPASGMDTINETLVNTINTPVTVMYVDTLKANGCSNTQTIVVTVNPEPVLTSATTAASICDSTLFTYIPSSTIESTTFTWSRGAIAGISNPAASGGDTISEVLINTGANPVNVVYVDSMTAFGCVYTEDVNVTVNPRPTLSSSLTPSGLCDSGTFNYTPASATTGATFTWDRPFVLGIALDSANGTGNPDERLINTSNSNLDVTYNYTITANGCSFNQSVVVIVHPTPTLVSSFGETVLGETVCSGTDFIYVPQDSGNVFGTTYEWIRPEVPGILPATNHGDSTINEILTDTGLTPIVTSYIFELTANGCSNVQTMNVTVNPSPAAAQITTYPPSSLCSNTLFQNFGTSTPPPAGKSYSWSAVNATIWATGNKGQYILVSFPSEGNAVVTLNNNVAGIACEANSSYTVNVSSSASTTPEVIYYNGQFMCLQGGMDSYQWGSDDAFTLDSSIAEGQVNQTYFISNPNTTNNYYWVITTLNGCMQKSYYNTPTGITNVNTGVADVKVYPNPTSNLINVDVNTTEAGNIEVQVLNMLGQKLNSTEAIDHKARINVSELPSGCYIIDCYREGVKIGAAKVC